MRLGASDRADHDAGCKTPLPLAMANPTIVVLTDRNDLDDQPRAGTLSDCG